MSNLHDIVIGSDAFPEPANIILSIPFEKAVLRPTNMPHSLYEELWHVNYWIQFYVELLKGASPTVPSSDERSFPEDNDSLSEFEWYQEIKKLFDGLKEFEYLTDFEFDVERVDRVYRNDWAAILIAHNAYHFGRMVVLRQLLGIWHNQLDSSW